MNEKWTTDTTDHSTWFERDRQHVALTDISGNTIIELWDDEVTQFVEDGFKSRGQNWHQALVEYANDMQLEAQL